tara:strand:- start:22 stop:261 length:240 start_codon:yes stop_codon:yes gene_type:complete
MKYVSIIIYISDRSDIELEIQSKDTLHEMQIFQMVANRFPAYCELIPDQELLDIGIDLGYETLGLKSTAYAYSLYRAKY